MQGIVHGSMTKVDNFTTWLHANISQEPFDEQYIEQSFAGYAEYMTRNKISNFLLQPIDEQHDELTIKVAKLFFNKCIDKSEF